MLLTRDILLIDALNQTYFLHLLRHRAQKVIPPGKSLLSMMTQANFKASDDDKPKQNEQAQIAGRVREVAHQAFWNEAVEALSSPLPSVQLLRLKRLYFDLYEALSPLFPPNHPVLASLTSPLPPTSSPLHSSINTLKEVLVALRHRCAPIRDQAIDDLLTSLSLPPEPVHPVHTSISSDSGSSPPTPLAEFVVGNLRTILELAEDMKTDLNTFILGSMTDAQLRGLLLNDVKVRERELVLNIWDGKDVVRANWRAWIAELPSTNATAFEEQKWIRKLFYSLESDKAVRCILPSVQAQGTQPDGIESFEPHDTQAVKLNQLPPQLFFSTPTLLYIQNYIQAIVIAAVLRSLTRLSPPPGSPEPAVTVENIRSEFMSRIWALLKTEVDEDQTSRNAEIDGVGQTKLINLADEVVSARRRASGAPSVSILDPTEEKRLRAAVEQTLRYEDPVFALLKKRLIGALEKRLLIHSEHNGQSMIPVRMQTGKDLLSERGGKRPRLMLPESVVSGSSREEAANMGGVVVPGFEDKVLQDAIEEILQKIAGCVTWVEGIWGDLV
ncbi:hypothetical protein CPB84DRAFT_1927530 [Gymnopilus junonius]|uniref:Uncharacterized protein n=1 Tax=Gymnopilus junonius TaxID=109634 RepID=A0A9P5TMX1_GYMJU|nr:hypothetical protein CPB84DRAFT_1927530 [Gymnopilus junonius]